jgi:hypothetical protein
MSNNIKLPGKRSRTSIRERFLRMVATQLGNPRGLPGKLIGRVIFIRGNAPINRWIYGDPECQDNKIAVAKV